MKYRAAVVVENGKIEIQHFEKPETDSRDMTAKVLMAGVCGTDVHLVRSQKPPFKLGHEWVGKIHEMGEKFPKVDAFGRPIQEGDRIVSYPSTWACGKCYACKVLLQPNLCMRPAFYRPLPDMGSAFADYFYIPEDSAVYRVPDHVSTKSAVLVEPMAVALRAFERAFTPGIPERFQGMGPGKSITIMGSGTIGALLVIFAKMSGAYPIIVVGGPKNRLDLCKKLGADVCIDINEVPQEERVRMVMENTLHNLGSDVVIEAAGAPSAFIDSIRMTRMGGSMVEVGHYTDHGEVPINPQEVCAKDIQIFGSWGYGPAEFGSALRILEGFSDKIDFESLVTHQFTLDEVQEAVETARRQDCTKAAIVL